MDGKMPEFACSILGFRWCQCGAYLIDVRGATSTQGIRYRHKGCDIGVSDELRTSSLCVRYVYMKEDIQRVDSN
jgi:hypothetical protein